MLLPYKLQHSFAPWCWIIILCTCELWWFMYLCNFNKKRVWDEWVSRVVWNLARSSGASSRPAGGLTTLLSRTPGVCRRRAWWRGDRAAPLPAPAVKSAARSASGLGMPVTVDRARAWRIRPSLAIASRGWRRRDDCSAGSPRRGLDCVWDHVARAWQRENRSSGTKRVSSGNVNRPGSMYPICRGWIKMEAEELHELFILKIRENTFWSSEKFEKILEVDNTVFYRCMKSQLEIHCILDCAKWQYWIFQICHFLCSP